MAIKNTRLDRKIEKKLGFKKTGEDQYCVTYERNFPGYDYMQKVSILHKSNGRHILQSYYPDLIDTNGVGCTCVGLTYQELKLFTKKMKQTGWV